MHGAPQTRPFKIFWRFNLPLAGPDRPDGPRNMFRAPNPETEAFRCGGIIRADGEITDQIRKDVHQLMTKLEVRISHGVIWDKHIKQTTDDRDLVTRLGLKQPEPGASDEPQWKIGENPYLPSGYTYLLQLAAHDLVDSVRFATIETAPARSGETKPRFELAPILPNARLRALMLDTVYGAGPFEEPLAYETDGSSPTQPRVLLRKFGLKKPSGTPPNVKLQFCPYADIMRGTRPAPPSNPLDVYSQSPGGSRKYTEAFIADPRNDDHSLISQLLVIFHLLHNTIVEKLLPLSQVQFLTEDFANRRFLCARLVTALIYRHILKQDVLSRVLDPDVYEAYMTNRKHFPLDGAAGIPVEFTTGAFRFGHAMVRENYTTNGFTPFPLNFSGARKLSASRDGAILGLPDFDWVIDWALFFGPDPQVNLSHRLGPHYASGLVTEPPKGEEIPESVLRDAGLGARDFLSAAYAGMWSVPKLIEIVNGRLRAAGLASLSIAPYDDWKASLSVWLKDYPGEPTSPNQLNADDIKRIAEDPPLSFFVMFEAAHELNSEGRPRLAEANFPESRPVFPGQGGRHLGRLGSILVADTMFAALHRRYFGFDEFAISPHEGIRRICAATVLREDALDSLFQGQPLDSMQDLLNVLQSAGVFEEP